MAATSVILRILFVGLLVLGCIIKIQDALFTNGKSIQAVRYVDEYFLLAEHLFFEFSLSMTQSIER
jgi:hypothetical protein